MNPVKKGPPVSVFTQINRRPLVQARAGQPKDLSVVIGEIPGGEFACYLFIEERYRI